MTNQSNYSENMKNNISIENRVLAHYYRSKWRGFTRLWNILKRINNHPFLQIANKYGAKFYLNPENYIDSHVIRDGYYESEVLEAILPYLNTDDSVLWDIGANFGLHAVTAKFLKPQSTVICIEPSPLMLAQLQTNSRLNYLKIEVAHIALSNSPKYETLHLVDGNPGMTTLKPWEKATYSSSMLCWCDSGDNLISNKILPQPTVIKLDVEGSELEVLLGMTNALSNTQLKAIIFEENSNLLVEKKHPIYELLVQADFTIKPLNRNEKTHHNLDNFIATRG